MVYSLLLFYFFALSSILISLPMRPFTIKFNKIAGKNAKMHLNKQDTVDPLICIQYPHHRRSSDIISDKQTTLPSIP